MTESRFEEDGRMSNFGSIRFFSSVFGLCMNEQSLS